MEIKNLGTNELCRELSVEEMQSISGGSFLGSIVAWFKRHFFHETIDEHSYESLCTAGYNGTGMYGLQFEI